MSKCYLCKTDVRDEVKIYTDIGNGDMYRDYCDTWLFHVDCFKLYEDLQEWKFMYNKG